MVSVIYDTKFCKRKEMALVSAISKNNKVFIIENGF